MGARERVGSGPGSGPGSVGSPLEELSCMFCVSLMHLWSLMWTPLNTVFLGRLGPSLEPIILQRLEGKAWRKGYVREVPSILGRLSNFLKTIDFEVFDRHKLENHCFEKRFEKQAPGSIPPESALMACLAHYSLSWLSFTIVSHSISTMHEPIESPYVSQNGCFLHSRGRKAEKS